MSRRVFPNLIAFFKANPDVSGQDLAQEFGISYAYMSMIKWGTRQPSLPLALRISGRCHVPLESLVRKHGLAEAS